MEISKEDAKAIADMLSVLVSYIRCDEQGAQAIADHAEHLANKLKEAIR